MLDLVNIDTKLLSYGNDNLPLQIKYSTVECKCKIFYVTFVKNISTNMNHAWETNEYTPILCKAL